MASTSGTKRSDNTGGPRRSSFSNGFTKTASILDPDAVVVDGVRVPSSLASIIAPILRAANEVEKDNPRVAYLCRSHAWKKAETMDPNSRGHGVRLFKKSLKDKTLEGIETKRLLASNDFREVRKYYRKFYEKNILGGQDTKKRKEMAKIIEVASVLYDVLVTMDPTSEVDEEMKGYTKDVERKKEQYEPYNILPLHAIGPKPRIMDFLEIKAAVRALCNLDNLPILKMNGKEPKPFKDILEWLSLLFGFQKGNVANQREHLILLLANMDRRNKDKDLDHYERLDYTVQDSTVQQLVDKIFDNYRSWCKYLHRESNVKSPPVQQVQLLYIGLYLLIWGEASNIRFMPECLCYIFHNMADEMNEFLFSNAEHVTGAMYQPKPRDEEAFLREVVTPIYEVLEKEAKRSTRNRKKASHSAWRNYDDLNEFFWSKKCLKLGWPLDLKAEFFVQLEPKNVERNQVVAGKPKTNFVEVRTFWHLYRSFDRMWIFFILALQVMIIIAWYHNGSLAVIFDEDVFKSILSIFITASILNFLRAFLDIILGWYALRILKFNQILRYIMKLAVAAFWVIVMPITYCASIQNPTGVWEFFSNLEREWQNQSVYYFCVAIYLIPNILAALLFLFPSLLNYLESSRQPVIILLMWWAQPKLYVGSGMHEDIFSLLKYTLFWIMLLICKLAFSFYFEILPLVQPTKIIMNMPVSNYDWHEFFPNGTRNIGVVMAIWAPVVMVYFMDTQIWYAIFSTIIGGIYGAYIHLGEIRTLRMLRSRFQSIPKAFSECLVPSPNKATKRSHQIFKSLSMAFSESLVTSPNQVAEQSDQNDSENIAKFSRVWNAFISSMRKEDLISNRERDMLRMPDSSSEVSVIQWPLFLLASKIPIALDIAKSFEGKKDADLSRKIESDYFMHSAVIECYKTLKDIMTNLFLTDGDKRFVKHIFDEVDASIRGKRFLNEFDMEKLALLHDKLGKFIDFLLTHHEERDSSDIADEFKEILDIITHDIMHEKRDEFTDELHQWEIEDHRINKPWREKVFRLHVLLTEKESAINVPMNLDARRRMTFFANSLHMNIRRAPKVRDMLSFSVLTPFYNEDVIYSITELNKPNEDGVTILFYLQKIYPDEWKNFEQRMHDEKVEHPSKDWNIDEWIRKWVSYRAQTLSRTVRGMMYYWEALELQFLDDEGSVISATDAQALADLKLEAQALADLKFTYVVSCQVYGAQKRSRDPRHEDILNLMTTYPSLRVAYIDERKERVDGKQKSYYYSVLVKAEDEFDVEIYRIKLPGSPIIGEGKPENQNHAIIFTRGEALQTIDMNQDNCFEEAVKMRNVLEEFHHRRRRPTILGLREHIFTGSVSSLAWFMSNQESSFVTIGQRILANPLRVRFHYGHPDIFDRIFHLTRGGISKASKTINLSEDIFSGYNSTLRGGSVTHHEYIQVGKGRDVGMNQISAFEAKVANGNGEQTLSRDVYRLGRRFDFFRMLSFYFTTVGFYFSSMVTVLTVYVFLYGRMYLVLSGLEREILENPTIRQTKALEEAMATQSVFQLGFLLVLPMVMEVGLERGFRTALGHLITMQLQLAPVFFTFQLGTKAHYYGRTILHGGAKYRGTGRGFVVKHAKFAENYRTYSRSHFVKGLELFILLIVYELYGHSRSSKVYYFVTWSMWFLVASWLFAPFVFNPSGFDWQKTVDDWTDWEKWMGNRGGIGLPPDKSWESWWDEEQQHLKDTNIRGRVLEIVLALRFFIYQYGIVFHLDVAHGSRNIFLVYGLSWFILITALLVLKVVSIGRRKFGIDFQLTFRILKALLFFAFISVLFVLFVVCGLSINDLFAAILAFMPTGWAFLLIAQACRPWLKGIRDSVMELARAYEAIMGIVIFMPVVVLSWFPFMSEFQTRLLFNQAFSRGLQISMILAGKKSE